jgi:two-component system CheB/CheR fusion protein
MLLDIGLPDIDGYELARRLRALPEVDAARLIAVTGYGQAEDRRRAQDAGFDDYLVKPVEFESLRSMLQPDRASA